MKAIEERAKEYAKTEYEQFGAFPEIVARESYAKGATEQKAIDDAEYVNKVLMGNGSSINYYKQGYHDAIEKACERLKEIVEGGVHPQNAYGFADRFLKEMEK